MICLSTDYEEIKKRYAARKRQLRQLPKMPEQIEKQRQGARIRSKSYRQKIKELGIKKSKPIIKTRREREKIREYWRDQKRKSRLRHSGQKKRRVKEYDRNRKMHNSSDQDHEQDDVDAVHTESEKSNIFPSPRAQKRAIQ